MSYKKKGKWRGYPTREDAMRSLFICDDEDVLVEETCSDLCEDCIFIGNHCDKCNKLHPAAEVLI